MSLVILAGLLSAYLCANFLRPSSWFHVLDRPNTRSLHVVPVPRTGGVAIDVAILVALGIGAWQWGMWLEQGLMLGWGIVALGALGLWDDRRNLSAKTRLIAQVLLVSILLSQGFWLSELKWPQGAWAWPKSVAWLCSGLFVLWMLNLYNFMDGLDGLAGMMGMVGFGVLGGLAWRVGAEDFAWCSWIVAAGCLGFLRFNFPPARIFMGDAGAPVLGLLAALFMVWADQASWLPLWVSSLVFSVFIVDASLTLLSRLWRGENVFQAHRQHLYQRLVLAGWAPRKVLLGYTLAMMSSACLAWQIEYWPPRIQYAAWILWWLALGGMWWFLRDKAHT